MVALLLFTAAPGGARSPDHPMTRSSDSPSPDSVAGEVDAAGLAERITREKGRVVLVNFWATWCVPCREEFPDLSRLQQNYGSRGLRILGVSTDFASQMKGVEK